MWYSGTVNNGGMHCGSSSTGDDGSVHYGATCCSGIDFSGSGIDDNGGMYCSSSSIGDDGGIYCGGTHRSGVYHSGIDCSVVV